MKTWILLALLFPLAASACIWDAQSLSHEKARSHDLAQTILGETQIQENTNQLLATIKELESNRKEADSDWWNNLAGSYLRLGQSQKAVDLLEPIAAKFSNNYGIHANLGTAYHLLGRYQDAEKEIARDLQINPEAHFGLEKYHLALLQYLERDAKYQSRHVYVDEFTVLFLISNKGWNFEPYYGEMEEDGVTSRAQEYPTIEAAEADYNLAIKTNAPQWNALRMLATVAMRDVAPAYRTNVDLHHDKTMEAGVIYMAQMNPKEPACYVMLGIAAWVKLDFHLAATAFDKAISLGSPQSQLLKEKSTILRAFIRQSEGQQLTLHTIEGVLIGLATLFIFWLVRRRLRRARLSK